MKNVFNVSLQNLRRFPSRCPFSYYGKGELMCSLTSNNCKLEYDNNPELICPVEENQVIIVKVNE